MLDLIQELPNNSEERAKERKERKWLSYNVLEKIPEQIIRDPGPTEKDKALAFRNALLIRWLLILPWRQRNIRECQLLPFPEGVTSSEKRFLQILQWQGRHGWMKRFERIRMSASGNFTFARARPKTAGQCAQSYLGN
jgi:hypothetical protein